MIIEIIVSAVLAVGIFFGGFFVGENIKPTQEITTVNATTYVNTEQKSQLNSYQAQMTIVDTKTNINVDLKGITNLISSFQTNTNYTIVQTNKK